MGIRNIFGILGLAKFKYKHDDGSEDVSQLQEDVSKIQSKLKEQESVNDDGRINTDKEVHDFLEGYGENEKLADKIGDNMTDEDILDTFGYKPGDIDFDNE